MPALRPCLRCGRLIRAGSRCPRCASARKRITPGRGSGGRAAAFRRAVLAGTGGRCAKCGTRKGVEAHHIVPLVDGGTDDPSNGAPLCGRCHAKVEAKLRRARKG